MKILNKIIFISEKNKHLNLIASMFPGEVTWVNAVNDILKKDINLQQFKLIVYSPLYIKHLYKLKSYNKIKIIGISLAFDLLLNNNRSTSQFKVKINK